MSEWWINNINVADLVGWLNVNAAYWDECDGIDEAIGSVIEVIESPCDWDREWGLYQLWLENHGNVDRCQDCFQALGKDTTADDLRAEWDDQVEQ